MGPPDRNLKVMNRAITMLASGVPYLEQSCRINGDRKSATWRRRCRYGIIRAPRLQIHAGMSILPSQVSRFLAQTSRFANSREGIAYGRGRVRHLVGARIAGPLRAPVWHPRASVARRHAALA